MKTIIGNWKMNGSFEEVDSWISRFIRGFDQNYKQLSKCEIAICPPNIMLDYIDGEIINDSLKRLDQEILQKGQKIDDLSADEINDFLIEKRILKLGAQDCHHEESGAYTGDISAKMIKEVGCDYVILGHCERRRNHNESDTVIAKKIKSALENQIIPVICLGESKAVREKKDHLNFLKNQLIKTVPTGAKFSKMIIAYEPIWSIGTGIIPKAKEIAEVANLIKSVCKENFPESVGNLQVLYGGSVSTKNAANILAIPDISGLLVGKASLNPEDFIEICLS